MLYLDGIIYILFIDMDDVMDLQIATVTCLFYKLDVFCLGKIVHAYHMFFSVFVSAFLLFFNNKQITKMQQQQNKTKQNKNKNKQTLK